MNSIDRNHASLSQTGESGDNYLTTGCKRHRAIKCDRRSVFLVPDPSGSQGGGQLAMRGTSCRNIYFAFPRLKHGNRQMRRRTEAKQSDPIPMFNTRDTKTAKTDDAGA